MIRRSSECTGSNEFATLGIVLYRIAEVEHEDAFESGATASARAQLTEVAALNFARSLDRKRARSSSENDSARGTTAGLHSTSALPDWLGADTIEIRNGHLILADRPAARIQTAMALGSIFKYEACSNQPACDDNRELPEVSLVIC